jgi:hypothetical protein
MLVNFYNIFVRKSKQRRQFERPTNRRVSNGEVHLVGWIKSLKIRAGGGGALVNTVMTAGVP